MIADPRHLPWDACLNVRDLGGFATRDGRTTRWRALVRADNLCRLTWHGRNALVRYGIRTVIDLRSTKELALEHDPFTRSELAEVARLHLPLLSAEFWTTWHRRMSPHEADVLALETSRPNVAALVSAIGNAPEGGVVIHCHAGKERTGLAMAVVLAFVGVDRDAINADHVASDAYLEPLYEAWNAAAEDAAVRERGTGRFHLDPRQMLDTLTTLDERFGGAQQYLIDSGVEDRELDRVRERLVEA